MAEREVVLHGIVRIERAEPAVISSAIFQLRLRRRVSPIERAMFSMCVSTGISSAAGGHVRPQAEVRRLAAHHPAQEEVQALARPRRWTDAGNQWR